MSGTVDELRKWLPGRERMAESAQKYADEMRQFVEDTKAEIAKAETAVKTYGQREAERLIVPNSADPKFGVMLANGVIGFRPYYDDDEVARDDLMNTIRRHVAAAIDQGRRDAFTEAAKVAAAERTCGSPTAEGVRDAIAAKIRELR